MWTFQLLFKQGQILRGEPVHIEWVLSQFKSEQMTSHLSYRHAFHAGGISDVLKHSVLLHILSNSSGRPPVVPQNGKLGNNEAKLQPQETAAKDEPVLFIDTHAGAGLYDLFSAEAQRTREFYFGVNR